MDETWGAGVLYLNSKSHEMSSYEVPSFAGGTICITQLLDSGTRVTERGLRVEG